MTTGELALLFMIQIVATLGLLVIIGPVWLVVAPIAVLIGAAATFIIVSTSPHGQRR